MTTTTYTATANVDMDKIAEKVQKLFALAGNNPSEEEAAAALLKAQALLAKYNINMEDVASDTKETYQHELIFSKVARSPYNNALASIIANSFACKAILLREGTVERIALMGRVPDVQAAVNALNFAYKVMKKNGSKAVKAYGFRPGERGSTAIYNTYASGFCNGLRDAMGEQTRALAIVVPQDTEDAYNERFPNATIAKTRRTNVTANSELRARGYSDGRSAMDRRSLV